MSSKPLIKESLFLLNFSGLHPVSQNVWSKLKACITAIILGLIITELAMEAIFHWNGLNSLQPVAIVVTIQLIIHRFFILLINRRKFIELLHCIDSLGPPNYSKEFTNFYSKLQLSYGCFGKKGIKCAIAIVVGIATLSLLTPIIFRIHSIILPFYHYSKRSPNFELANILGFLGINHAMIFLSIPHDFLFGALVIHLVCELKILKEEIRTIDVNGKVCGTRIELFINHHSLVLRSILNLNDIYSGLFLNQFLSISVGLCSSLVAITSESLTNWMYIAALIANFLVCLLQLFVSCMAGTILNRECEEISLAAYESKWWIRTQPKLRRSLVLIVQRAQVGNVLTAAGTFPMNFESFAKVLKMAYSFYSLAQSFRKK